MPQDFDPTPLLHQAALTIQHKSRALNATHLLTIHVFQFNHAEELAHLLVLITKKVDQIFLSLFKFFMGFNRITRDSENMGPGGFKSRS